METVDQKTNNETTPTISERIFYPYPDLLGFIFHLSWMYLFLYLDEPIGFNGLLGETISPGPQLYVFSACFLVLTLALFAFRPWLVDVCERSRFCRILSPLLITLGSALFYALIAIMPGSAFVINLGSGMATGIGSGILAIRWARSYGLAGMRHIMEIVPSLLVGITALCVTLPLLPDLFSIVCVISFPLLSGLFCTRSRRALVSNDDSNTPDLQKFDKADAVQIRYKSYIVVIVAVAFLGTALGLLNSIRSLSLSTEYLSIFYIVAVVALLAACSAYLWGQKRQSFIIEFGIPTLTLCFFVVLLVNTQSNDFYSAIRSLGSICLELLFFVSLVCWADFFSLSAVRTFALGRIAYAVTNYFAGAITKAIPWASGSEALIQANSFALFAGAEAIAVAAVLIVYLTRHHSHRKEDAFLSKHEVGQHDVDNTVEVIDTAEVQIADAQVQPSQLRFRERLMQFSNAFGFTAREIEVAAELIKGRGYAHIADELSIAEGTVNYHIRNIYAKTQVHTREELIDLFDGFEVQ